MNIIRTTPFPKCKYCGKQLDYYVFGMKDEDHSHPECAGRAMANKAFDRLKISVKALDA